MSTEESTPKKKRTRRKTGRVVYDPEKHCGAKTSVKTNHGGPCTQLKGFGTPHLGEGRCKYHGGLALIKHGRYSTLSNSPHMKRYHQLREQYEAEPDPLNLVPDLIHLRARAAQLHEDEAADRQALADWHESYTGKFRVEMRELQRALAAGKPEELRGALMRLKQILHEMPPKPVKLWDPFAFTKAVNVMATLVGKISEQRERRQVPMKAIIDLQDKMALVMMQVLRRRLGEKGNAVAAEIADNWREINIEF